MEIIDLIKYALEEDFRDLGDITTDAVISSSLEGTASLVAKEDGILCGSSIFSMTFLEIDKNCLVDFCYKDGDEICKGDIVAIIKGSLASILKAERTALNFIQRLSGIATKTNKIVSMLKNSNIKLLDTRKTTPCLRNLEKYAVKTGNGVNHRMGLYDMFMIKDNHIATAGSITKAVSLVLDYKKNKNIDAKIEVEVKNIEELKEAIALDIDIIMLDNMSNEEIRRAVLVNNKNKKLEVSGNITEERIRELSLIEIDFISMGSLTHSYNSFDFSLLVD